MRAVKKWYDGVSSGEVILSTGNSRCGKGLLMYGAPGHGKTTIALSVIQEMMTTFPLEVFLPSENKVMIRPCYFITFNDLIELRGRLMDDPTDSDRLLFDGIHGEAKDDAYNVRVLVLDDVGKEHESGTTWQKTMLHQVLRTRFNNGLPTIITTNMPLNAWTGKYGEATESFAREAFMYLSLDSNKGDLRR
jgi:DNA replication protein DnaC